MSAAFTFDSHDHEDDMDDIHDRECHPESMLIYFAIVGTITLCLFLASLYGMYKLCRTHSSDQSKKIVSVTFAFYVICGLIGICIVPYEMSLCYHAEMGGIDIAQLLNGVFICSYVSHWLVMLAIFYIRTSISFQSTAIQLPRFHLLIFIAVACVVIGLLVTTQYVFDTHLCSVAMIGASASVMVLVMAIYSGVLLVLFVRRLHIVDKHSLPCDHDFMSIMVRQCILLVVTLLSSGGVITATFAGTDLIHHGEHSEWWQLAATCAIPTDTLVDAMCVSLGFSSFDSSYYFLCGALDRCIKGCCARSNGRNIQKAMEIQLAMSASTSGSAGTKDTGTQTEADDTGTLVDGSVNLKAKEGVMKKGVPDDTEKQAVHVDDVANQDMQDAPNDVLEQAGSDAVNKVGVTDDVGEQYIVNGIPQQEAIAKDPDLLANEDPKNIAISMGFNKSDCLIVGQGKYVAIIL